MSLGGAEEDDGEVAGGGGGDGRQQRRRRVDGRHAHRIGAAQRRVDVQAAERLLDLHLL